MGISLKSRAYAGVALLVLGLGGPVQASELWQRCGMLEDPSREATLADVKQRPFLPPRSDRPPKAGFTSSAIWLKCEMDVAPGDYILTVDHIYLNQVDVYLDEQDHVADLRFGLAVPLRAPEIPYYGYAVGITVTPQTAKTIYVRAISNWPITWPAQLVPKDQFVQQQRGLDWMFGFYMGVILILIAYNLFIYVSVKDPAYLYYIAALFSLHLFSNLAQYGLVRAFVFPNWTFLQTHVFYFTHFFSVASVYLFGSRFLQFKTMAPRAGRWLLIPVLLNGVIFSVGLFADTYAIDLAFQVSSSLFSYGILGLAGVLTWRGLKQGRYFLVAWSLLIVFWMITFLRIDAVVPLNFFTSYSILFGAALEGLLLSLALADRLNELRAAKEAAEMESLALAEKNRVMQQVTHDIRAPLSALEVAIAGPSEVDEGGRLLIKRAIARIRDITNDLKGRTATANSRVAMSIPTLVDFIVSEKRMQYSSVPQIEIDWRIEQKDRAMFALVEVASFKRLVSNLIDNAVEAMGQRAGTIRVRLEITPTQHVLSIEDEGPGVPDAVMAKLGREPVTLGKEGTASGSGLGVYHAATTLRGWGGDLRYERRAKGARVCVLLPPAELPTWFLPEIYLQPKSLVVVVDDDPLLKRAWSQRLEGVDAEVLYFSTPEEVLRWIPTLQTNRPIQFLVDYEFRNSKLTGLDLADALRGRGNVILATNHFDDESIQEGCQQRDIRLLAKSLLGIIPLTVRESALVLIDDDRLVRMAWEMGAHRYVVTLLSYDSFESFCRDRVNVPTHFPIYMDANLPGEAPVADRLKKLKQFGFKDVYVETGESPEAFSDLSGCKGVVGKGFPIAN